MLQNEGRREELLATGNVAQTFLFSLSTEQLASTPFRHLPLSHPAIHSPKASLPICELSDISHFIAHIYLAFTCTQTRILIEQTKQNNLNSLIKEFNITQREREREREREGEGEELRAFIIVRIIMKNYVVSSIFYLQSLEVSQFEKGNN
ncbi:unnamed protein product [Onchocerca flexuosa]|uniref:Uncharacterized protein n=1 Tax=Onchocerca flexuosa TaxID=387005 RepID=A0A183HJI2_9BILA|nr:unnamed protein product [Onchocerca flexuosa]